MDRKGLDEAQVERIRRRAEGRAHRVAAGIVHADVEDRPRPAPVGVLRRRPDRHERRPAEKRQEPAHVRHLARGDPAHRGKGQRDRLRDRKVEPDQPLQALRPAAVLADRDRRRGRDLDVIRNVDVFLHRGMSPSQAA
jgi:hypothetical protein